MANEGEKKQDKFDFDSAGEERGYISLDQARVLAIQHAPATTRSFTAPHTLTSTLSGRSSARGRPRTTTR